MCGHCHQILVKACRLVDLAHSDARLKKSNYRELGLDHAFFVHFVSYKSPGREIGIQIKILIGV